MFHFIVLLVPIYYSFCICFISYIFICYSFHYKYFCNYLQKKEESNSRNSYTLNFILSQYSLQSGFSSTRLFHHLPHLWLSTVLLKVHHFISLCFLLFALHFAFTLLLSLTLCHTSGHIAICHKPRLALRFCHFIPHTHTHTHTLSLSLSFSLRPSLSCIVSHLGFTSHISASCNTPQPHITHLGCTSHILASHSPFGSYYYFCFSTSALAFLHSVTSQLHITNLGLMSHTSASHHTSWPHVTHLGFASHISASHSPFGFYYYFCLVLWPLLSCTVSHLGFTSHILAPHYASRPHVTLLGFALHTSLRIFALPQAFNY